MLTEIIAARKKFGQGVHSGLYAGRARGSLLSTRGGGALVRQGKGGEKGLRRDKKPQVNYSSPSTPTRKGRRRYSLHPPRRKGNLITR